MISALFYQFLQTFGAAGLLALYLVLHLCVGFVLPYRRGFKPYFFALIEHAGLWLEQRLNRESRPQPVRFMRGLLVALVMGGFACLVARIVQFASAATYGWVVSMVFLSLCINFMSLLKMVRQVLAHLRANELPQAAAALQPYVRAPLEKADSYTLIRQALECVALSLNRFLVAPVLWYLVAGPMGMAFSVAYAALNQAFGLSDMRRKYFGRVVRIIDTFMNVVPSCVTSLILCFCAVFVSKSNPLRAIVTLIHQGGIDPLSWPLAAMAGGLGVTLGGPVRHSEDYAKERAWIGPKDSSARLFPEDLGRAAMLQYVFFVCLTGILSFMMILTR